MAGLGNDCYGSYAAIGRCTSGRTSGCAKGSSEPMRAGGGELRAWLASLPFSVGPTINVGRSRPSVPIERYGPPFLLLGVHRMLGFFVKLILQSEARLVGFDRLNGGHDGLNPVIHFELAEFAGGDRAISGVVIGETRVPPDSGVKILRQMKPGLVRSGLIFGAIHVNQIGE